MVSYLGLVAATIVGRRPQKIERDLITYLLGSAAWNAFFAGSLAKPHNAILSGLSGQVALGGLALLSVLLLKLTHNLLGQESRYTTAWWVLGVVSLILVVVFTPQIVPLGLSTFTIANRTVGQIEIVQVFSVLVWGGFELAALLATWRVYRKTTSPVYRNRHRYWLLVLGLQIVGDALFATLVPMRMMYGGTIRLTGALVATLTVLRHRLPDIKSIYRRAFGYVAVTLGLIAFNLAVSILIYINTGQSALSVLIGSSITAVVAAFFGAPARKLVQRLVDRRLFHIDLEYEVALRRYGKQVIKRLRLAPLAELLVETLISTTNISRGGLYLIQEDETEVGGLYLHLIQGQGELPQEPFELAPDSALTKKLTRSVAPLTQYEIDLNEDFASLSEAEQAWLQALSIEVLVPIHSPADLVGLIVVGAKGSGESYAPSEIDWFEALAAQTAVALENARLFDQVEGMSIKLMRLNADLEQAYRRLQEVDRLKSAFIGVITHELRSPFVAAGLSVELLRRYVDEGMIDELGGQVQQLNAELNQGRRMIDSVISFASLLGKRRPLQKQEFELLDLLRNTLTPLEKMARARNIALTCALKPGLPAVEADKTRLSEAIYHMVHNAIKFNQDGGEVHVSCWSNDGHIVFKVKDTGKGIPQERIDHIWDAFTQEADDVRRGVEGLGIGLALVKFVVEAHQGDVWASSKLGEGSTFGFRIPQSQRPALDPHSAPI
jgi:signal transduction histidine kinase